MRTLLFMISLIIYTQLPLYALDDTSMYHKSTIFPPPSTDEHIATFLQPIKFTGQGIKNFFNFQFNTTLYAQQFLPACFVHLTDFLHHAVTLQLDESFAQLTFELFNQRLKESKWVNPYALMSLLKELPKPLKEISTQSTLEDDIENVLRNELLNNFSTLKRTPDEFITNTSRKIKKNCMQAADKKARLSTSIMRFLEQALNKIIWNPHENLDIWRSATLICSYLENIHNYGLLDTQNFNQLLWSLLYQFGYFIECTGGQLPDTCYKAIEQDLRGNKLTWLTYPELDKHLITKQEYLEKVISFGRLKKYSAERGILAEKIA